MRSWDFCYTATYHTQLCGPMEKGPYTGRSQGTLKYEPYSSPSPQVPCLTLYTVTQGEASVTRVDTFTWVLHLSHEGRVKELHWPVVLRHCYSSPLILRHMLMYHLKLTRATFTVLRLAHGNFLLHV